MRPSIGICAALLLVAGQVNGQESRVSLREIQAVADSSLVTFARLVTQQNYKQMGFASREEVRTAKLGAPIQDFMVRLDALEKYEPTTRAEQLLTATNQVVVPVLVGAQVRSSITLSNVRARWRAASFGGPNYVKLVTTGVNESSRSTGLPPSSYFVVRIPALTLFFVGYRSGGDLMLVPLVDDRSLEFRAGVPMKAEKVFTALVPRAKAHNGLPR